MSLPAGFLDELRRRVSLPDVIGKRVRLTRRGRQYLGLCPFHGEKTPSFHVYEDHYHCFGCGAHGSLFDFVMQSDKVEFREAVERIANLAGLAVPRPSAEADARERKRASLQQALEAAAAWFQQMLKMPDGRAAQEYLARRGVEPPAIGRFRLGWAPDGRSALKAALSRDGFAEDALIEAGLLVAPEDGTRSAYDRFRGRVMFPIGDRRGRIVGFGGRLLGPGEPKYLNSPETPLFHKGSLLYNLSAAAEAARTVGTVVVVEGYMDAIALSEAGWRHVVAPLGTALTEDQLRELWRLAPEPILLFDPDTAGERAALRAAERALPLLEPGRGLRFAFLATETGDDPDGVVRRYPAQFMDQTLAAALPLSEFLFWVETRGRRLDSGEARAALQQRLSERAATAQHPAVRAHLGRAFRDRLWQARMPRGDGKRSRTGNAGTGFAGTRTSASQGDVHPDGDGRGRLDDAERTLLAIVAVRPDHFDEVEDELGALVFAQPPLDRLRQELVTLLSGSEERLDADQVAARLAMRGCGAILADLLDDPLVRSHRNIAPGAPTDALRRTWAQSAALVRARAAPSGAGAAPGPAHGGPGAFALLARGRSQRDDADD